MKPTPASPGPRARRLGARIADAVLGVERANRQLARRGLLAAGVYAVSVCGELLALRFGFADPFAVACLSAYMIAGAATFYVLIRTGWNRRFADATMSAPQILFPISALLAAYPVNGPFRGINLLAVVLPPLFGFVAMSRRSGVMIVAGIPPVFGLVMLVLSASDPVRFDPRLEALHFAILSVCMAGLGVLLWQISGQRDRVRSQKSELSRALERIEAVSTQDELTGLYNRRYMAARLEDEVGRRARGGPPFCVCLIDIDFFKRINDAHGHARGDTVLRGFADMLRAGLREVDIVARWGGEEFLMLLPATMADAGIERVERLRRYNAEVADWGDAAPLRVRFSAGVAEDGGSSVSILLEQADAALYDAKATGRDRVVGVAASLAKG